MSWSLEVVCLEEVSLVTCAFSKKKVHSLSVSPRASCYLEQKVGGSWILCCLKTDVLKKSSEWCALFWRKSALTECSPRASCYLEQRVRGSWILCCLITAVLKEKVHSLSVAPVPLAIWNKELEGLESELFKELKTSPIAAPEHILVLLFKKNSDTGSWHVIW